MPDQDTLADLRADVPDMTNHAFDTGRAALLDAIAEESHPGATVIPLAPRRAPKRRRVFPLASAAAALALLAGGTAVVLGNTDHGGYVAPASGYATPPPEPPGVDVQLPPMSDRPYNAAADLARLATDPPMPPGSYLYAGSRTRAAVDTTSEVNGHTEVIGAKVVNFENATWVPAGADTGRDWRRTVTGDIPHSTTTANGGKFEPSSSEDSWMAPSPRFLLSLPRDPKTLYEQLVAVARNDSGQVFARAVDILRDGWAPSDLRAALFGALAYHPWVTVDKNARTSDGKPAIALIGHIGNTVVELRFDPGYARFVGERTTVRYVTPGMLPTIDQPRRPGALISESTMDYAVVPSIGAKPE